MRTKEAEYAEHFAQAIEILNAVYDHQAKADGETRTRRMTTFDLICSKAAFLDLLDIAPDLTAMAMPSILAGFIAGLPKVGYRIVKA